MLHPSPPGQSPHKEKAWERLKQHLSTVLLLGGLFWLTVTLAYQASWKNTLLSRWAEQNDDVAIMLNSGIPFSIVPKGNYVLLRLKRKLKPGTYRFEFRYDENVSAGIYLSIGSTPTPTPTPIPLPPQKWIFVVP